MKTSSALILGILLAFCSGRLTGKDDEYTLRGRKAAQAFLASPGEKSADNDELDFYPLLDEFFHSGTDAATKEYRLRCHLYYQGLLIKSLIAKDALKENAPEDCAIKMRCFDREPISGVLPDWNASKAQKPSFESLLDLFFDGGQTTVTIDFRTGCQESWESMKSMADFYDFVLAQTDSAKQQKIISRFKKWQAIDEKRNERDKPGLEGGTGASIFMSVMEMERNKKFSAYLKNMELMDEIEHFQVRCIGKDFSMQNGELDFLFPKTEYTPEHSEQFAIILPATVKKQTIGKDVWHVAVFLPDYLIPHEVKHGGCLVVWKNGKHVASFPWEKDVRVTSVVFSGQKKVKISGFEIDDYDKDGDAVSMEYDFSEPNGSELNVNYGLEYYLKHDSDLFELDLDDLDLEDDELEDEREDE